MTKEQAAIDVRNLNVPVLLVVSIVAFFVWATSFWMNERHNLYASIKTEIRRIEDRILAIDNDLNKLHGVMTRYSNYYEENAESRDAVFMHVCEVLKKDNPTLKCKPMSDTQDYPRQGPGNTKRY